MSGWLPVFGVERPEWLWLLLLAVPVVALAYASRRRISRTRRALATGVRTALLVALVLSLAGLTRYTHEDALGVVFVVDRSASLGAEGLARAEAFVREAVAHAGPDDHVGVVAFGSDALVDREPGADTDFRGLEASPSAHGTDIAAGLRLATALLPSDRTRRIVVVTDGDETRGDAASQVLLTAGDDLEVAVAPIAREQGPDVLLDDLVAPPRVDEGAAFALRVVARAEVPATGRLRLFRNETYLGEREVSVGAERAEVFTFRQEATEPGIYRYRAVFQADDAGADRVPQNNEVMASVQVTGRPRVLYAEGDPEQAGHLVRVLEGEGFVVDLVRPEELPAGPEGLRPYAIVILSDAPAYVLARRQQEALRSYVRDLGRGLVMIGGDRSFGLGGYHGTPVEQALPVRMDLEDKSRFPKLAIAVAMDKSCSMGGGAGSKLQMAKEAAIQTAELLSERDTLGVIGFDSAASWIVPLTPLTNRRQVVTRIAALRAGGGTDIYPGLDRAIRGLRATDAALKHVILLSDGITAGGDYETLVRAAHADHVTLTSIAVGGDADRNTMRELAGWGGGQYYLVTDPTAIPAIFTREAMLASRSFLVEETFRPAPAAPSDMLEGIDPAALGPLHGYVATEPKARAVVGLVGPAGPDGEAPLPVLAHWRYGLGRAVAFTSDAKARWARDVVGTQAYTRFWAQLARWTAGDTSASDLQVDAAVRDGELVVTVDAFDDAGGFRNFLDGQARVVAPDLTVRPLALRQVGPGRYQAAVPADQDGSWLVGVSLSQGDAVVGQAVAEAVQPYSPEYRSRGAGPALARELGRLGGGGLMSEPAQAFARPDVPRSVPHPLSSPLLVLAGLLLLLDVAVRRLDPPWGGVRRVDAPRIARPAPPPAPARPAPTGPAPDLEVTAPATVPDDPAPEAPDPVQDNAYVGGLLAARRKARRRMDDDT